LLYDTGIRAGELLGLRVADLVETKKGQWIRVIGKGDKQRLVPVPPKTFALLKHYAAAAPLMRFGLEGGMLPTTEQFESGYIFLAKRSRFGSGTRLTISGLEQVIRHLAKRAGIKRRIWVHLLRHTAATRMYNAGMPAITLAKILGHTDLTMIMRTYAHVAADDTYAAMMRTLTA